MDLIRAELALAEKHVADDARILAVKRRLIEQRQCQGRITTHSEKRLNRLEQRLAQHVAERDRLREKLERRRHELGLA
jgi:hypothetical protein